MSAAAACGVPVGPTGSERVKRGARARVNASGAAAGNRCARVGGRAAAEV